MPASSRCVALPNQIGNGEGESLLAGWYRGPQPNSSIWIEVKTVVRDQTIGDQDLEYRRL